MFFVLAYASVAIFQWCEMQKANRISQDSLEAQTRPWVLIEGDPSNISATENEVTFELKLRNYGPNPAFISAGQVFNLTLEIRPKIAAFDYLEVCKRADDLISKTPYLNIIPPKTEGITQLVHATRGQSNARLGGNPYYMYGCLAYRGPNGRIYHTRVVYRVQAHDSGPGAPRIYTAEIKERPIYDSE